MVRCGLAAVETREIETLCARNALRRFFSAAEIRESRGKRTTLAGKLAAKRALARALGRRVRFCEVSITREATGKPSVGRLPGVSAGWLATRRFSLSISHTETLAVAFCLVYDTGGQAAGGSA